MGSNNSKSTSKGPSRALNQMSCTDDLMCQNIDSKRSIPGQPPVLVCPDAKCMQGTCSCGKNCQRDPYTGMCCSHVETRQIMTPNGIDITTFCIEGPSSSEPAPKGLLESFTSTFASF